MRYAILHERLCDNYELCPSLLACKEQAGSNVEAAIYLDVEGHIKVDKERCIGCECCLNRCGLFRIVGGIYEETVVLEEFAKDPRAALFDRTVERFGCDIIDKTAYLLKDIGEIDKYLRDTNSDRANLLEFVDVKHAICPYQAIEVEPVIKSVPNLQWYKKLVIDPDDAETIRAVRDIYSVEEFPAVAVLYRQSMIGIIGTNYRPKDESQRLIQQKELVKSISKILKEAIDGAVHQQNDGV